MANPALQLKDDNTPVDIDAFQKALQNDKQRLSMLQQDDALAQRVLSQNKEDAKVCPFLFPIKTVYTSRSINPTFAG